MTNLSAVLSDETYKAFKKLTEGKDYAMSEVVRHWVENAVEKQKLPRIANGAANGRVKVAKPPKRKMPVTKLPGATVGGVKRRKRTRRVA